MCMAREIRADIVGTIQCVPWFQVGISAGYAVIPDRMVMYGEGSRQVIIQLFLKPGDLTPGESDVRVRIIAIGMFRIGRVKDDKPDVEQSKL